MRRGLEWLAGLLLLAGLADAAPTPAPTPTPADLWQAVVTAWAPVQTHTIGVWLGWPGHNADELEAQVTRPVERRLVMLPGIRSVVSRSDQGVAWLLLEMAGDALETRLAVRAALEARRDLPEDLAPPEVVGMEAVVMARIALDEVNGARRLREALLRVPGVARVGTCGLDETVVEVNVDARRLPPEAGGMAGVARALDGAPTHDLHVLTQLALSPTLRLGDVATISLTPPEGCRCHATGKPAACITVWAAPGAQPNLRPTMNETAAQLPPGRLTLASPGPVFEAWGTLAGEAVGAALVQAVAKVAPQAWLQVWPDRFALSAAPETGAALVEALATVPGVWRASGRWPGVPDAMVWVAAEADEVAAPVAEAVVAAALKSGARDARTERPHGRPTLNVEPVSEQLALLGLSRQAVARTASVALAGEVVRPGRRGPALRVRAQGDTAPERLGQVRLTAAGGVQVPLSEVVRVTTTEGPPVRWRRDGQRALPVRVAGLGPEALARLLAGLTLPAGVAVSVGPTLDALPRVWD